ncbi:DUF4350 domain-containing protein [Flavobacterium sp. MAH-1]|uniref:DUF4350 domain-containing protein n=1 Tax=Flavobacterium agri TaxID=2743471 RepID=A0A7Y9C5Q2_9FLAO|nr:DUF4350 domain-containing protein [Flavobacterium agri]NUY81211.1 DUF4350 domain-containing protein [Flavobacterium agri]NYA71235.1 DUF4350 domain-containing protein [Flavobacterium agri]
MGKLKIYIGVLVLLFAGIIILDSGKPKEIDWTPSYSVYDRIPFGLYVLDHEIDGLTGTKVRRLHDTPYEFLDSIYDFDNNTYKLKGNILNISGSDNLDDQSVKEIFYYVSHGNSAFISMSSFPEIFKDSLNIATRIDMELTDTLRLGFANPRLGTKKYALHEGVDANYFSSIDTLNTTVLGTFAADSSRVNFVKVNFGNGAFYLHTTPAAFTNIHMLKDDHSEYAAKTLSYLPEGQTYWYVSENMGAISSSPLRFITSQPALYWAWLIFVFGMLAFMVFNARRKQRIVPILEPLPNTTVDFAKTIGNLYFQEGDHHTVIDRKIIYFLEKIRNDYLIDTTKLDDAFVEKLHQKSGKELALIEQAVFLINHHRKSPHTAVEEDLIQINTALEKLLN